MRSRPVAGRHLGWSPEQLRTSPFAAHYQPEMAPLSSDTCDALAHGALPPELLPTPEQVAAGGFTSSLAPRDGYALEPGGGLRIALRTPMPAVAPAMIDWWFGWHGDSPERYKLWHPRAHVHVEWQSPPPRGSEGRARYVGHTSIVDEYVGGELGRFAVQFVAPETLGYDAARLDDRVATAVCARVGLTDLPIDAGLLVHEVIAVPGGSEMRSYFWLGGRYAQARGGVLGQLAVTVGRHVLRPAERDGRALLTHCAEEMAHLATFLPSLYREQRGAGSGDAEARS